MALIKIGFVTDLIVDQVVVFTIVEYTAYIQQGMVIQGSHGNRNTHR